MARTGLDLQTVLSASAEIADAQGVEALSLAVLAQKLGIRSPSLYNHVNGLPGLRNKLVLYGFAQLKEALTRAAVGKSKDDAVRAIAEAYLTFVRRHPGVYEAISRYPDMSDPAMQKAAGEIVEIVVRVLEAYGLRDDAAIHVVRGFRSLVHGFASIEQQGGFGIPLDLNVSFGLLVDTFLAGIHALHEAKQGAN
ncbi:TetR family transcriptional regulator [Cohnella sp. CFH 77786]|uniref:TetR/AcrR family transcriptional regulator n=1 Tax=Cohnella sp. CFH 77786 TaxID=2662265 RepID=UPI001C60D62C|nr:TetR/AcrR family transcriptional regulator [Cohnella sp. CFH 77786]MBW5448023.1 TetR family transcriptional regulator [Cohnella sp. CFH 77786]